MGLRLLHAADVLLDTPLAGIVSAPRDAVELLSEATLIAWERLVDAAITHDVEAVLLTGNTFVADSGSLAADVAFRQGCERLAEKQIPLFVTPGLLDPVSAWDEIPALPDNVNLFQTLRDEGVELTERGRTACLLQPVGAWSEPAREGQRTASASRPFSVGLWWEDDTPLLQSPQPISAAVDVVCCRQGADTAGWLKPELPVQRQASPQGMTPVETGPRGATLIEVDLQRRFTRKLLALAPVRRERLPARLDAIRHRDDLCDQMLASLEELPVLPGEQLRLIDWAFTGSVASFQRLEFDDDVAWEIIETLNQLTDQPGKLRYLHQAVPLWQIAVENSQMSDLWREYLERFDQRDTLDDGELRRMAAELRPDAAATAVWERGLQSLDPQRVVDRARRYGRRWFAEV